MDVEGKADGWEYERETRGDKIGMAKLQMNVKYHICLKTLMSRPL